MKKFEGTHECFNCSNDVRWQATVRERSKREIEAFVMSGQQAEVAFKSSNTLQVKIACSQCGENNIFDYSF